MELIPLSYCTTLAGIESEARPMANLRKILRSFWFIHLLALLGLFALLGYIVGNGSILLFWSAVSFYGAICGSFIRVIDTVRGIIK